MALEGSAGFGLRTLPFKLAFVTCTRRSNIFIVLTLFKKLTPFQGLPGWTGKSVSFSVVGESFFGKDTLLGAGAFLSFFQRLFVYHRIIGGIRLHQAGIHKYFSAVNKAGLHTLPDNALKKDLKRLTPQRALALESTL